jgi:hypothetical protein
MGLGLLGVAGPPPWPGGGFGHPIPAVGGGSKSPKAFFFFFFLLWWPDHPFGHGGGSTTPRPIVGVAILGQNGSGQAIPFLAKGVA